MKVLLHSDWLCLPFHVCYRNQLLLLIVTVTIVCYQHQKRGHVFKRSLCNPNAQLAGHLATQTHASKEEERRNNTELQPTTMSPNQTPYHTLRVQSSSIIIANTAFIINNACRSFYRLQYGSTAGHHAPNLTTPFELAPPIKITSTKEVTKMEDSNPIIREDDAGTDLR